MAIVSSVLTIYVLWKTEFQVVYIRLPALIRSILNIMDAVRPVKVCIFNLSVSFMGCVYPYIDGLLVVYTVSEVDLNLQDGCLCASECAQNS
jgi:hypothetical protein